VKAYLGKVKVYLGNWDVAGHNQALTSITAKGLHSQQTNVTWCSVPEGNKCCKHLNLIKLQLNLPWSSMLFLVTFMQ